METRTRKHLLLPALLVLLAGALGAQSPAPPDALGFHNGPTWVPLQVDGQSLGLRFDPALDEAAVRRLAAELPLLAPGEAERAPWLPGQTMIARTRPGTTPGEAWAAAAAFRQREGVLSASPLLWAGDEPLYLTEEILVRWRPGVAAAEIAAWTAGLEETARLEYAVNPGRVYRVPHGADPLALANRLAESGLVEFSHPDFQLFRRPLAGTNDPLYGQQWHLESTGQNGAGVDQDIDVEGAWNVTRGDPSIIVAVIDTGVELQHPDLKDRFVQGIDVLGNDNNPQAENGWLGLFPESHATSVSGVAAGSGNNGIGITGVAQQCSIMPIRFLSEFLWPAPTIQDEADAFNFAANHGAAVVNCSWGPLGGATLAASTRAAMENCIYNGRGGLGTVIFFAAGNSNNNNNNNEYAATWMTANVTAVTDQGVKASYSSFGDTTDFCAPSNGGVNGITTTDRLGWRGYSNGDYTSSFGGTSSASPCAAGVALLVLSANPALTWQEVIAILRASTEKVDPAGGGYDAMGHSRWYGYGRVNAAQAVALATGTWKDTLALTGPTSATVGSTVTYGIGNGPANGLWYLLAAGRLGGTLIGAAFFDLDASYQVVASGNLDAGGGATWTSAPLDPSLQGLTVFLEAASWWNGVIQDSNVLALAIQ